jgi:DNA-binding FadR family transcriptional regulator
VNARVSGLHERLLRRGDLRASIVAALRHDFAGEAASERAIVEGVGATRLAVRRALAALAIEAAVEIDSRGANRLGHRVRLIATHRAA